MAWLVFGVVWNVCMLTELFLTSLAPSGPGLTLVKGALAIFLVTGLAVTLFARRIDWRRW